MKTALIVIDVQMAFVADDEAGVPRSCPEASENIATLMAAFRSSGADVIHVHHHEDDPDDPFFGGGPGAIVQPFAAPIGTEKSLIKKTSSAFVRTDLDDHLKAANIQRLILCGAAANYCVESTARSAGDLGYDVIYVGDAVWTYGETGPDGTDYSAEQMQAVTMANLHGAFATVKPSAEVLAAI